MGETPQNFEISQEMIDKLLSNTTFLDAVAKKLGTSKAPKLGGFVDAGEVSGGAFPQMTKEQLYNYAKAINGSVDQTSALTQYNSLAKPIIDTSGITDTLAE